MKITVNNKEIDLPADEITIKKFLSTREIPENGTAVSVNDSLVCHDCWESSTLSDGDKVLIISAAFGG